MLIIYAEKSSLAKAIANVLKAGRRIACEKEPTIGYYEFKFKGEDAILCHGTGHLASLASAKSYGSDFEKWDLNKFPCIPDIFKKVPKQQTLTCHNLVKDFFEKADWIINATDPDREGELIFGYVYETTGCKKPWKRVWIEDLTDEKITYAFNHLKDSSEVLPLQMAGRARDISDWLIGCNLTIANTKKFSDGNTLLSVGRVQTPTLALIVNREKAIISHKKTPFWKLTGMFQTPEGAFEADYEKGNFTDENSAKAILSDCNGHNGKVIKKDIKQKTINAPLLFNTTQLQVVASKKLGWELAKTTAVMQKLYENKMMTYPRTSSEHLTEAMIPEITDTIEKLMLLPEYTQYAISKDQWTKFSNRHFDDKKVGSHPAITPTKSVPQNLDNLSDDEKQLYDILAKSLLRTVYPKATVEETIAVIDVNNNKFKVHGSIIKENGWYSVDALPDKKKTLPIITENSEYQGTYELKKGETEPPKRYTEAYLISAMELAGQNLDDEEARTLMKMQKKGLGTDATRNAIIQGLFKKGLIATKGKSIIPTEQGIFLIDTLPVNDIKSAEITGDWEKRLNDISINKGSFDGFISEIKQQTKSWYNEIINSEHLAMVSQNDSNIICPFCKKTMKHYAWGYGCTGYKDGCKFSINGEICGKKITESQVITLIKNGKTNIIKGFTAKSGNKFDAILVLDKATGKINFEFPQKK